MPLDAQNARIDFLASALRWTIGTAALVFAVLILGVGYQSYAGRRDVVNHARAGCLRGLFDRVDNIEADLNQASFAYAAASARRAEGDTKVAADYDAKGEEAKARAHRRMTRLLGTRLRVLQMRDANGLPLPVAVDEASRACARANPDVSPWPWDQ